MLSGNYTVIHCYSVHLASTSITEEALAHSFLHFQLRECYRVTDTTISGKLQHLTMPNESCQINRATVYTYPQKIHKQRVASGRSAQSASWTHLDSSYSGGLN